ncbi:MAG: hypothetical protein EPO20_27430 [Betaproteobacteria bacterium]|nr:MAG: hypothetical protein EPO20_27430 [Betaproteobacteria bacterium]
MNVRLAALALLAPLAFSGCATVFTGEMQSVALDAQTADGEPVAQADCTLKNDRGSWKAEPPAQVQVRRSDGDLMVECRKDGFEAGFARLISRVYPRFVAEALLWGVGPLVDHLTGSAYNYPAKVSIKMGTSVVIDKRDEPGEKKDVAAADAGN